MLVERERELRAVDAALARIGEGRGAALLITGPAGIGKTALLAEVRRRGMRSFSATGGELEHELAFTVVRQLLEPALRQELLTGAAGLARPVFEASADPASIGGVVHGLYWLCSNLADEAPLLLVVDDIHWVDESSLLFLTHLARRIEDLPILLVLAGRPVPAGHVVARALEGLKLETLQIEPLSTQGVGLLVREALSETADGKFCEACATASGGNPFLLTEALRSVQAAKIPPVAASASEIERLQPESIGKSVLTRLARLGPEAVKLARAVAVLGPAADLRRAAELAALPQRTAAELADRLAAETIVRRTRPLEFVHPLVRTAVYADSSDFIRATDHKRAAILLHAEGVPVDQLAPHLIAAEPESDPWVVETLRATAAGALSQGASQVAAACLERAMAEPPAPHERATILVELGRSLGMANRPDEAGAAFREAFELSNRDNERADIALELGQLMIHTGRGAEAVAAYEMVQSVIKDDDLKLTVRTTRAFLMAFAAMEPPSQWMARLEALVQRQQGNSAVDRMLVASLAFGAAATGNRTADETARLARLAADGPIPAEMGWQLTNFASTALAIADRFDESLDLLDRGADAARGKGDAAEFRYMAILRSHTALFAGRLKDAEADARSAHELDDGSMQDAPLAAAVLIDALMERGELAEAQQILTGGGLEGDLEMNMLIAHFVLLARGRLRRRQGRHREALADLRQCGQVLRGAGYNNPGFAPWRPEATLAHLHLGELDEARALAAEDLELTRKFGAPLPIGSALRTSSLIEAGDARLALLAESVEVLKDSTADLARAQSLIDYGAALRRTGQKNQAQELLREGLDVATRCGAVPLAERAHEELVTSGARPRRALLTGPGALTASELRVVRLAVDGLSNRDIAQALFVSRRTVEIHLTNAYRKLGVESRQQLSAALE